MEAAWHAVPATHVHARPAAAEVPAPRLRPLVRQVRLEAEPRRPPRRRLAAEVVGPGTAHRLRLEGLAAARAEVADGRVAVVPGAAAEVQVAGLVPHVHQVERVLRTAARK